MAPDSMKQAARKKVFPKVKTWRPSKRASRIRECMFPSEAELWSILIGLQMAWAKGIRTLDVECNSFICCFSDG
ncbi:unnamed protein product [Prunus armeniaca]